MHKYQGMDYKQIGEVLKLSESATEVAAFQGVPDTADKLKGFRLTAKPDKAGEEIWGVRQRVFDAGVAEVGW